jgi:hypothetical protein
MGVPFEQWVLALPQTHVPAAQRLLSTVHWESVRQPSAQVLFALQYASGGQSLFCVHATHSALALPLLPRQMDVGSAHVVPVLPQTQL